ncbi:hypothetical protein ACR31S_10075 [Streptococcus iniae]
MKKNLKTLIFSSLSAVMLFSAAAVSANEPEYTGRPVHTFETITTYDTSQYLQELNGLYDYLKIEPERDTSGYVKLMKQSKTLHKL